MRHIPAHNASWLRRIAALTGAAGLLCLGSLAPATALARPVSSLPSGAGGKAKASDCSGTRVTGTQKMWNGKGGKSGAYFPTLPTVCVSQTTNLTNQFVTVSWTGFTPSNTEGLSGGYNDNFTLYPVQVAECAGTDPSSILANCDGLQFDVQEPGKAGPTTQVEATTGKAVSTTQGGAGDVSIQILTSVQDSTLGCSEQKACSLVILPIDGGDYVPGTSAACQDHKWDSSLDYATAGHVFATMPQNTTCAWADRIIVPLHFAPNNTDCRFSNPDFTVAGSPMMQRAMTSWITKLCGGSNPVHFTFEGTLNEPDAVNDFLSGSDDVALTTEPTTGTAVGRSFTYAPVGISATVIAYWMDNPKNGEPYGEDGQPGLQLTPRLVAKLITESYDYIKYGCTKQEVKDPPQNGCDDAVYGNPENLWADPDFRQYNAGIKPQPVNTVEDETDFPTVLSGNSDMTYELTRWIAANPAAMSFVDGTPDPWGMRVNTNYLDTQFPEEALESQDQYALWEDQYSPQFPLTRVVAYQASNYDPGVNPFQETCAPPEGCEPTANPNQVPGQRDLLSILDEPDAAADSFPVAAIENHAGKFVTPDKTSMTAAVDTMTTDSNGITKDDNENTTNSAAYPLTMVVYAMVPTSNTPKTEATKIAQWLTYVAKDGQSQGIATGQLPLGYLPLPASMRSQTLKAAAEVLHQSGDKPSGHNNGGGSSSNSSGSGGSSPKGSSSSKPSGSPASSGPAPAKVNAAYSNPDSDGMIRWVLPILLAIGALLALAGPSAIVFSRPGGRAAIIAGWHRVTKFASHLGRNS
jgi:hypothetical protein